MTDAELLAEAMRLKALDRAGWKRVGVVNPESVAAHSWGVALAALLRCPPELNREKVLMMALLHDLAEVRIGDITPHDGVPREEKKRREQEAALSLFADHPELVALWQEAESQSTPEARFVKSMDLLDMGLQALEYSKLAVDTSEFLVATLAVRSALESANS